jgi:hypothetical protein
MCTVGLDNVLSRPLVVEMRWYVYLYVSYSRVAYGIIDSEALFS